MRQGRKCSTCGRGRIQKRKMPVKHEIHGIFVWVPDLVCWCDYCGEILIDLDRVNEHGRKLDRAWRKVTGCPSAEEIRQFRESRNLSYWSFGRLVSLTAGRVRQLENGVLPRLSEVARLRRAMGL